MIVNYGTVVPKGYLPVYSVDTEDEARLLLTMACPTTTDGRWIAEELAEDQTLERLSSFGKRLAVTEKFIKTKCPKARDEMIKMRQAARGY